jgi:hypothetical protein
MPASLALFRNPLFFPFDIRLPDPGYQLQRLSFCGLQVFGCKAYPEVGVARNAFCVKHYAVFHFQIFKLPNYQIIELNILL